MLETLIVPEHNIHGHNIQGHYKRTLGTQGEGSVSDIKKSHLHCQECILQKFGFLENGGERVVLKPFLITFAEEAIDGPTRIKFN